MPRIQARIREIQAELADHQNRERDVVVGKLEVVYQRALEDHHFYAAARAAELQARLTGVGRAPAATEDGQRRHPSRNPSQMSPSPEAPRGAGSEPADPDRRH